ncbi:MAG: NUDIX hydrolase [Planctomycetes bacterium]|nr:NUDIX hydrolase [Planctomycetota bacterium]
MSAWIVQHCPACGARLVRGLVEGRERARCATCTFVHYENPAPVAGGVVLDGRGSVVLVRRALEPGRGAWALPAGFQEHDETPAEAAAREVREESGLEVEVGELLELAFVPGRRRSVNLALFLCRPVGGLLRGGADVLEAAWFRLDALPADLAFENGPRFLERLRGRR